MACFELLPRARVGWHTARTSVPPPPPCSSGAPVRWLMARGRRASGVAAAPRSHAAGAPAARRRRAVGGACACRTRSNGRRRPLVGGWVGGWCALQLRITSGWLPLIGGSIYPLVLRASSKERARRATKDLHAANNLSSQLKFRRSVHRCRCEDASVRQVRESSMCKLALTPDQPDQLGSATAVQRNSGRARSGKPTAATAGAARPHMVLPQSPPRHAVLNPRPGAQLDHGKTRCAIGAAPERCGPGAGYCV